MVEEATKKENPDEFLVEYTSRLIIQHLLLIEDHLLDYNREPSDQCLACIYWHLEKLIAYSSLECVKFEGMDVATCQSLSVWATKVQESLEGLSRERALEFAKESREYRYKIAETAPAEAALVEEMARMFRKKAEPRWCHPVKETDKELGKLTRTLGTARKRIAEIQRSLEMPINICRGQAEMFEATTGVLDPYGSRCRDPKTGQWTYSEECGYEPAGITTTALGMDGVTNYEFEFKIVNFDKLIVSHDPFTFAPNPDYPEELQPRLRERAATKIQVEKIAANLEPDAVIIDFHVIDRGTPIVGPDLVVEAGNGRVMGIIRAAADHPD